MVEQTLGLDLAELGPGRIHQPHLACHLQTLYLSFNSFTATTASTRQRIEQASRKGETMPEKETMKRARRYD